MSSHDAFLAASGALSGMSHDTIQWLAAGLIVLAGLVIYGGRDLLRFSLMRSRAIASVCFDESIRRRVLWLIPLAILGVVLVSQFQRPLDEQDAIRQVTKFCIFASGLLVTITAVILTCTNIPKEIDNRVIYTVVTKPTTRLEILVGKIMGFAGVSAVILVIMGLFTWGYLHYREMAILSGVRATLAEGGADEAAKQTLEYYSQYGLLDARYQVNSTDVQAWGKRTNPAEPARWFAGEQEQTVYFPFRVDPTAILRMPAKDVGMIVELRLPWEQRPLDEEETKRALGMAAQADAQRSAVQSLGPMAPGQQVETDKTIPTLIRISFADERFTQVVDPLLIDEGKPILASDPTGQQTIKIPIRGEVAARAVRLGQFYLTIEGLSTGAHYMVKANSARLLVPSDDPSKPTVIKPCEPFETPATSPFIIRGRQSFNGQQLRGGDPASSPAAVFAFRNQTMPAGQKAVAFEFRTSIERTNEDDEHQSQTTHAEARIVNHTTGKTSEPKMVPLESRRTTRFVFPAEYTDGGSFDVVVQCVTPNHWLGLRKDTLHLASPDLGFGLNLAKGYLILWLFSVLVITIAIFCSTFLSWPIAVVLTLLILLGHWGVTQLGDMAGPGVGRQVVGDLFQGAAPAVAETLNRSMEGLTSLLKGVSLVLPDISSFGAMEELQRGTWISFARLLLPMKMLVLFALPILSLSYVFFRNKEVAP